MVTNIPDSQNVARSQNQKPVSRKETPKPGVSFNQAFLQKLEQQISRATASSKTAPRAPLAGSVLRQRVASSALASVTGSTSGTLLSVMALPPDIQQLILNLRNKVGEIENMANRIENEWAQGRQVELPFIKDASGQNVKLNVIPTAREVDRRILEFWHLIERSQRQAMGIQIYEALENCSSLEDLPRLKALGENYLAAINSQSNNMLLPAYSNGSFVAAKRAYFNEGGRLYLQWYLSKPNRDADNFLESIMVQNVSSLSDLVVNDLIRLQNVTNPAQQIVNLHNLSHQQGTSVNVANFDAYEWNYSYTAYVRNGFNIMQEQAKNPDSYSLKALAADYMASYFKIFMTSTNPTLGGVVLKSSFSGTGIVSNDSQLVQLFIDLQRGGYIDNFFSQSMSPPYDLSGWINFQKVSSLQNASQLTLPASYTVAQKQKIFDILKLHLGLPGVVPPTLLELDTPESEVQLAAYLRIGNYSSIKDREIQVREALIRGDQRITLPGEFTQDGKPIIQDRQNVLREFQPGQIYNFQPGEKYGYFHRQANLEAVYAALYEAYAHPYQYPMDMINSNVAMRLVEAVDRVVANSKTQFSTYVVNFTDPRPGKPPVSFSIADPNCAQQITNYLKYGTRPPIENSQEMKDTIVAVRDTLTQWLPAFLGYCWNTQLNQPRTRNVQVPFTAAADGSLKVIFKPIADPLKQRVQDLSDWAYVNNIWKPAQNRRIQAAQLVLNKLNETPKSYEVANILREITEAFWRTMSYGRSTMTLPARPGVTSKNINFSDGEGIVVLTRYLSTLNT